MIVNLFGGPGTGKSTSMAHIFAELKWRNIECEMAPEYAKDKVWEQTVAVLENQMYIFGKQHHRIWRLAPVVDVVVTDSPLILSCIYGRKMTPEFKAIVLQSFNVFDNFNIMLTRTKPYHPKGRLQTESEARDIDAEIRTLLMREGIPFTDYIAERESIGKIVDDICERLGEDPVLTA